MKHKIASSVISIAACCAAFLFSQPQLLAQTGGGIVIDKDAKTANPTLVFQGVTGNNELSARVQSDLLCCGWFDVVRSGKADYSVSGTASGNSVTLRLTNAAGAVIGDFSATGNSADTAAHLAVDKILKELFNIPGICNSKIVFSVETSPKNKEIYVSDFNGRNTQRITGNQTLSVDPSWAPDGKSIVYTLYAPASTKIVQYQLATKKSRLLTSYRDMNLGGAISPDGRHIALILTMDGQVDLYVRETEGKTLKRLTRNKATEASPCWSPDGTKICFTSDVNGRPVLYVVNAAGGNPVMVRGLAGSERVEAAWNTDNKLTYCARIGGVYTPAVATMNQEGTSAVMDTIGLPGTRQIAGESPCWAPDKRHIAVSHRGSIIIIDTRLGKTRTLFSGPAKVGQPDWSPLFH